MMMSNAAVSGPAPRPAQRTTILIADDDPDMRALLATALRHDDFDVVEAEDGPSLLDGLLESGRFGAVVADVNLPEMSGLDALSIAHLMTARELLPDVLMLTGDATERVLDDARLAGAVGVLRKPIDLDDLRLAVRLLVSGRRR